MSLPKSARATVEKEEENVDGKCWCDTVYDRATRRERRFADPLALNNEELVRYYRFPSRELIGAH